MKHEKFSGLITKIFKRKIFLTFDTSWYTSRYVIRLIYILKILKKLLTQATINWRCKAISRYIILIRLYKGTWIGSQFVQDINQSRWNFFFFRYSTFVSVTKFRTYISERIKYLSPYMRQKTFAAEPKEFKLYWIKRYTLPIWKHKWYPKCI